MWRYALGPILGRVPATSLLLKALAPVVPPACFACGAVAADAGPLCAPCRRGLRWLDGEPLELEDGDGRRLEAWAPLAYRGGARALARALKFRGAVTLAEVMAAQIAANAPPALLQGGALVPVPLHPARRRRRGFNQAERLAHALARRTGAPVVDCLERQGGRGTQMGRDRDERLRALEGAFTVRRSASVPRAAVLVDDVLTTGATVLACARALREGGGERVGALTYARTSAR